MFIGCPFFWLLQWEKKCKTLQEEADTLSEKCHGPVFGPSSDIHNQLNYGNIDKFDVTYSHSVKSHPSNGVLPLQYYTNEYQVSDSGIAGFSNACQLSHGTTSLPLETCSSADSFHSKDFAGMHILSNFFCKILCLYITTNSLKFGLLQFSFIVTQSKEVGMLSLTVVVNGQVMVAPAVKG